MTGNEMAAKIRGYRGKVKVGMITAHDVYHVYAVKHDLVRVFDRIGNDDAGAVFTIDKGTAYVDVHNVGDVDG